MVIRRRNNYRCETVPINNAGTEAVSVQVFNSHGNSPVSATSGNTIITFSAFARSTLASQISLAQE